MQRYGDSAISHRNSAMHAFGFAPSARQSVIFRREVRLARACAFDDFVYRQPVFAHTIKPPRFPAALIARKKSSRRPPKTPGWQNQLKARDAFVHQLIHLAPVAVFKLGRDKVENRNQSRICLPPFVPGINAHVIASAFGLQWRNQ